ncbi:MAG: phosphotransferase [Caulobacteraceae bacterium]|nr:phosphotransferase [Caulobacteraceae bacterium]
MSEREAARRTFLAANGLAGARREPLAGDASTRRYERLHTAGASLILMDQPPRVEGPPCPPDASEEERRARGFNACYRLAAGRVDAYSACAGWLRGEGLSAPEVIAFDAGAGLAILEDLGDGLYARALERGADEDQLYAAASDVLHHLRGIVPPATLATPGAAWPLLDYDDLALRTAGDLYTEWTPRLAGAPDLPDEALEAWEEIWAPIRRRAAKGARVFCHRDFHAENLVWLPERRGVARVGLLDFQDAVRAHPAWDLSMLLHDARRDVGPLMRDRVLERTLASLSVGEREAFVSDFHALGALNILRILGIFARLVVRDGKPRYRALMPRLRRYLADCLAEPALARLTPWLARWAPAELSL